MALGERALGGSLVVRQENEGRLRIGCRGWSCGIGVGRRNTPDSVAAYGGREQPAIYVLVRLSLAASPSANVASARRASSSNRSVKDVRG